MTTSMKFLLRRTYTMICVCLSIWTVRVAHGQTTEAVREALRSGGLHAAAKLNGHFTETISFNHWQQFDLTSLVSHSTIIIVGRVVYRESTLAPDGLGTLSSFSFKPYKTIKTDGKEISFLQVPGGKVTFTDGTTAEQIYKPEAELATSGANYLFFLERVGNVLRLIGQDQGLVELDTNKDVAMSKARDTDAIKKDLSGSSASALVERVKALTR